MRVTVKLFARAKDLAGTPRVELDLVDGSRVHDLKSRLAAECPALAPLVPNLLTAIGTEYAADDALLTMNSDVACFPPVSGG